MWGAPTPLWSSAITDPALLVTAFFQFVVDSGVRIIEVFFTVDTDGTGNLDPIEFETALERMRVQLTTEQLDTVFNELDDDSGGTIEIAEIMSRMRKEQKEGRLHPKREAPKVVKKSVDNDEETQATLKRITVVQAHTPRTSNRLDQLNARGRGSSRPMAVSSPRVQLRVHTVSSPRERHDRVSRDSSPKAGSPSRASGGSSQSPRSPRTSEDTVPLQGWHYLYDKHRAKCSRKEAARDRRTIRERMATEARNKNAEEAGELEGGGGEGEDGAQPSAQVTPSRKKPSKLRGPVWVPAPGKRCILKKGLTALMHGEPCRGWLQAMTSGDYPMGGTVKLMDEALYGNDIMAEFDNGQVMWLDAEEVQSEGGLVIDFPSEDEDDTNFFTKK